MKYSANKVVLVPQHELSNVSVRFHGSWLVVEADDGEVSVYPASGVSAIVGLELDVAESSAFRS